MKKPDVKILETFTAYPHYCRDCGYMFYGMIKGKIKPCRFCETDKNVVAAFGDKK